MPWIQFATRQGQVELIYRSPDAFALDEVSELKHLPPGVPDDALVIVDGLTPKLWWQLEEATRHLEAVAKDAVARRLNSQNPGLWEEAWEVDYTVVAVPGSEIFGAAVDTSRDKEIRRMSEVTKERDRSQENKVAHGDL